MRLNSVKFTYFHGYRHTSLISVTQGGLNGL